MDVVEDMGLELEPMQESDLTTYGIQLTCTCSNKNGLYNPDCCMHDCKQKDGTGTKWVDGWG